MNSRPQAAITPSTGFELLASFIHETSQYYLIGRAGGVSSTEAAIEAVRLGGALASIETLTENRAVFSTIDLFDSAWNSAGFSRQLGPWIGAERQADGSFAWQSGASLGFTAWASGEPNNYGGNENAVHFLSKTSFGRESTWNDIQTSGVWPAFGFGRVSSFLVETDVLTDASPQTTRQIFATEGKLAFLSQLALAAYSLAPWETEGRKVNDINERGDDAFGGVSNPPDGNDFEAVSSHIKLLSSEQMGEDVLLSDVVFTDGDFPKIGLKDGIFTNANAAALVGRSDDALFLSFRGTNDNARVNNGLLNVVFPNTPDKSHWAGSFKSLHYELFDPLIEAVRRYVDNPYNGIDEVYVTGHSLGASMVEALTSAWSSVKVSAVTFASPGYLADFGGDDRIVNFWLKDDPILSASWSADNDGDKNTIHHNLSVGDQITNENTLHSAKLYSDFMRFFHDNGLDQKDFRNFKSVNFDHVHANVEVIDEPDLHFTIGTGNDVIKGRIVGLGPVGPSLDNFDDMLLGGAGKDVLVGRGGRDYLKGGTQNDLLKGDSGRDFLEGGNGFDRLLGGNGSDLFIFNTVRETNSRNGAANADRILDFASKGGQQDRIDLSGLDAERGVPGNQAFDFIGGAAFSGARGELRFELSSQETVVQGDMDGDGQADFHIRLSGAHNLLEDHFIL